jgi:hypothetical protein
LVYLRVSLSMTRFLVLISTRRIWRSTWLQGTLEYKPYQCSQLCSCVLAYLHTLSICLFVCCCLFSSCLLFRSRFWFVSERCGECVRNWVNCLRILYSVYFLFDGFVLPSTLLNGTLLSLSHSHSLSLSLLDSLLHSFYIHKQLRFNVELSE